MSYLFLVEANALLCVPFSIYVRREERSRCQTVWVNEALRVCYERTRSSVKIYLSRNCFANGISCCDISPLQHTRGMSVQSLPIKHLRAQTHPTLSYGSLVNCALPSSSSSYVPLSKRPRTYLPFLSCLLLCLLCGHHPCSPFIRPLLFLNIACFKREFHNFVRVYIFMQRTYTTF
jgi:hypothetical protein